jgi:hypothetical protein
LPTGKSSEKQKTKTVLNMQMADFQKVNGGSGKRKWVHYVKRRDKVTGSRGCLKRSERWGPGGVVAQGCTGSERGKKKFIEGDPRGTGNAPGKERKCPNVIYIQYTADTTKCILTDEQKKI